MRAFTRKNKLGYWVGCLQYNNGTIAEVSNAKLTEQEAYDIALRLSNYSNRFYNISQYMLKGFIGTYEDLIAFSEIIMQHLDGVYVRAINNEIFIRNSYILPRGVWEKSIKEHRELYPECWY
jgi:hypothetical protein